MECPHCRSSDNFKYGVRAGRQGYRCRGCSKVFTDDRALTGRRVSPEIVGTAAG